MRALRVLTPLFAFWPLLGCETVRPWERGTLSHPSMDPASQARAACEDFNAHTFDVREGSICATGRVGGGCGCN